MPRATHSRPLYEIGKPLSPAQSKKLQLALENIAVETKAAEDRERKAPRLNFIARARRAGFTVTQAEFLWDNRFVPEPRLIG